MSNTRTSKDIHNVDNLDELPTELWMIRPCLAYEDEYKECKSWKGRFHQNYVHGERLDCSKWQQDMQNCYEFSKTNSPELANAIITNEKERRQIRLQQARNNNVWEYRVTPPGDWVKPLPEHLTKTCVPKTNSSENKTCVIL